MHNRDGTSEDMVESAATRGPWVAHNYRRPLTSNPKYASPAASEWRISIVGGGVYRLVLVAYN